MKKRLLALGLILIALFAVSTSVVLGDGPSTPPIRPLRIITPPLPSNN